MTIEHVDAPVGEIHVPYNWTYADQSAREAASITNSALEGRLARQLDDNSLWMLVDTSPAVWAPVGGGAAAITIKDESTTLTTAPTMIAFVGAGVTASVSGNDVTVTVPT